MFQFSGKSRRKILLLPPTIVAGNKGDEAMFFVICSELCQKSHFEIHFPFPKIESLKNFPIRWMQEFAGINFFKPSPRGKLWLLYVAFQLLFKNLDLAVVGADSFDGNQRYIFLLLVQALRGRKIFVFGSSYKENPGWVSKLVFRLIPSKLLIVCSRDSRSQERFQKHTLKKSFRVGDLAFLLKPQRLTDQNTIDFIRNSDSSPLVVFFPAIRGTHSFEKTNGAFIRAAKLIPNCRILVIDHIGDTRNQKLCESIFSQIINYKFLITNVNIFELRSILTSATFGLSSLLHPSIACLTSGVPIILVEYANKAQGIFEDFGCPELILTDPDDFVKKIPFVESSLNDLRVKIRSRIGMVQELSKKNFEYFQNFIG